MGDYIYRRLLKTVLACLLGVAHEGVSQPNTPATTVPPIWSTATRLVTTPLTTPPGSCLYNGKLYIDGETIEEESDLVYGCFLLKCQGGGPVYFDHECFINPPGCAGEARKIVGQCCPECNMTTTTQTTSPPMPTTPLPTPPGSCVYEEELYYNGQTIESGSDLVYKCYGMICKDGSVEVWDDKCVFIPQTCSGISHKIKGQCCEECDTVNTTTPTTTPTTARPCFVDGSWYSHGETVNIHPRNCWKEICNNGVVERADEAICDLSCFEGGVLVDVGDQCCKICVSTTDVPTTTVPTTTVPPPLTQCRINGSVFNLGDIVNFSPCLPCLCTVTGISCTEVTCPSLKCDKLIFNENRCCPSCIDDTSNTVIYQGQFIFIFLICTIAILLCD